MRGHTVTVSLAVLVVTFVTLTTASAQIDTSLQGAWIEQRGFVIMEVEHTDSDLGQWVAYTAQNNPFSFASDFEGDGYLRFTGNSVSGGGVDSELTFKILISHADTYTLEMRAMKTDLDGAAWDHANDCYVKMVGQDGCEGSYSKFVGGELNSWSWLRAMECSHHSFSIPEYELDPGVHTFCIAGRSKNFFIDRVAIHLPMQPKEKIWSQPESARHDGSTTMTRRSAPTQRRARAANPVDALVFDIAGRRVHESDRRHRGVFIAVGRNGGVWTSASDAVRLR